MQRIGIVSPEASGLSWWSRLQDEGFDVKVFIAAAEAKTVGDGIVPKAKSWNDMIAFLKGGKSLALFDSSREGKKADLLRTMGIPVVGGGAFCDRLEEDRAFGESVAAAIGCATPEKHDFTTVGQAIAFAKTMKGGWYFKSDTYLKSDATYGSDNPEEMVRYLEFLRECYGDRIKNMMQQKIDGAALSTGCWWNGRTFVGPFEGTIERKKFLNDDLGPATGCSLNAVWFYDDDEPTIAKALGWKNLEAVFRKYNAPPCLYDINGIVKQGKAYFLEWTPRCYSRDTEVLTASGWKPMIDVAIGEMVAGLDDDKRLVYVPVQQTVRKRYLGNMVRFKAYSTFDLLVTPDHAMVYQDAAGKMYSQEAQDAPARQQTFVRTASWAGIDIPFYTIPGYIEKHHLGKYHKTMDIPHEARTVPMETWCKFMALYLSNGHIHNGKGDRHHQIYIAELKQVPEVAAILDGLGFKYSYHDHSFCINSTQLAEHLFKQVGKVRAWEKRLPRYILDLAPKYLEAFLDGYTIGDGSVHWRHGQRVWTSCSKGLAEDINEVVLRVGRYARMVNVGTGKYPGSVHEMYQVRERRQRLEVTVTRRKHIRREWYYGDVVCLTVPHHRLYVRRPGNQAIWCGNCGWDSEATSQALIEGSLGQMLVDLADGKLREVPANRDEIAYGVRVSVPPYPTEEIPKDAEQSAEGTPVWGMDSLWEGDFAAYCLRKADKGTYEAADPSGLLGVGLATGTTLTALHRSVMGFLKRDLVAPAKQYRTDGVQAISDDAKKIAQNGIRLPAALTR